jgi:sterol desaturase/sphingolipid hydroxylase (fatty acid hydroxylase superfamily)
MKVHHRIHHDKNLMDNANFGIVEPLQDYIWLTKK